MPHGIAATIAGEANIRARAPELARVADSKCLHNCVAVARLGSFYYAVHDEQVEGSFVTSTDRTERTKPAVKPSARHSHASTLYDPIG